MIVSALTTTGAVVANAVVVTAAIGLGLVVARQSAPDIARDADVTGRLVGGASFGQLALDLLQVTL